MGTPEKPTTRGTTRRLKATQDLQTSDSKDTGLQLQIWRPLQKTKRPLQKTNLNCKIQAWNQMGKCTTTAAAGRNSTRLVQPNSVLWRTSAECISMHKRFQTLRNKWAVFSTVETNWKQLMPSFNSKTSFYKNKFHCFDSRWIRHKHLGHQAPLHEWNRGLEGLCLGGFLGSTYGPHYLPREHITPQASTIPGHYSQQGQVGPNHRFRGQLIEVVKYLNRFNRVSPIGLTDRTRNNGKKN